MALGFESTENWISLIFNNLIENKKIELKEINFDLKMYRYYNELFSK
jgi:hypothetical protein